MYPFRSNIMGGSLILALLLFVGHTHAFIGGTSVTPSRFPWFVSFHRKDAICGGALIAPDTVLTSGSCALDNTGITIGRKPYQAIRYVVHHRYPSDALAVVLLDKPVQGIPLANVPWNASTPSIISVIGMDRGKLRVATGKAYTDVNGNLDTDASVCGNIDGSLMIDRGSRRDIVHGVGQQRSIPCPRRVWWDTIFVSTKENMQWIRDAQKMLKANTTTTCDLKKTASLVKKYRSRCPSIKNYLDVYKKLCSTLFYPGPTLFSLESWAACYCPNVFEDLAIQQFEARYTVEKPCPETYRGSMRDSFRAAVMSNGVYSPPCQNGQFDTADLISYAYGYASMVHVACVMDFPR